MRDVILNTVIVAMLFVTMEGVADANDETSFHQTHHAHAHEDHQWYPDSDGSSHDSDACEHFCHAHVLAVPPQLSASAVPAYSGSPPTHSALIVSREIDPPIPPPNI